MTDELLYRRQVANCHAIGIESPEAFRAAVEAAEEIMTNWTFAEAKAFIKWRRERNRRLEFEGLPSRPEMHPALRPVGEGSTP